MGFYDWRASLLHQSLKSVLTQIKQMKLVDLKIYDSQSDNHGMISETVRSVFKDIGGSLFN